MKFRLFAVAALMIAALCGCSTSAKKNKTLVFYYSQTGATKAVAEELQSQLGADIACIEVVEPYNGDYAATVARWRREREAGVKVAIQPLAVDLDQYDTIFLGFPIWGGTFASPMATFLDDHSLAGKTVVTFATFGSGGIDSATADVAAAQPDAKVIKGYGVRNARVAKAPAEISRFLIENGYVEGEIAPLPEYGEAVPVTDEDVAVFDAACGDYQFPLGTPVTVAKRSYDGTQDYRFDVKSQTRDGGEALSTIYVVVPQGGTPEFTQVLK
ncbi:flavodoxin [Parabacteroides sp. ZJ-118]|uniref:flavodoxin n=1 Tax=Parabacteroides sp. ZJ-118 TaxID=2709398 RepID=UPI001F14D38F|nr:flavodoxin [Parabacteroides sp. ZJ-118]